MEFLCFLLICGAVFGIVQLVKGVLAKKDETEYEQFVRSLVDDRMKMVISDIEHDYMVEFTDEQWEAFLKESNPAKAALCAVPKGMPPLEEFHEKLLGKGKELLYGFGLDFETADRASALLKKEIEQYDRMCLKFLMMKINQTAVGEYEFMRNIINYDSTVSGILYDISERMPSEELKWHVLNHAKKKGWEK